MERIEKMLQSMQEQQQIMMQSMQEQQQIMMQSIQEQLSEVKQQLGGVQQQQGEMATTIRMANWEALRWRRIEWTRIPYPSRVPVSPTCPWRTTWRSTAPCATGTIASTS